MNIYQQILVKYWGFSKFRPLQEDIIRAVSEGKDTLGLMPTGGGKSITFQVTALLKEGICIVVTPLIALMKDQVESLRKKNIKATAVYSGMSKEEIDITLDNCAYGDYKFLYVSPERLGTELFQARVRKMNINLLVVDESHCISQWGYDFRPSYLKISNLRDIIPNVPVLALTATATNDVIEDIQEKLKFKKKNVLRKSFERKNLIYLVQQTEDKNKSLLKIVTHLKGSGIIYARNRLKTKEIAYFLKKNKISADYYHAGLSAELRNLKQDEWKNDKTRIIVATNAFGMGIDKPNVRFVVHMDLADCIESYFQEAGRAGRDEKKAYAIQLYNHYDKLSAQKRTEVNFPDLEYVKRVYQALGNYLKVPIGGGKYQEYDFKLMAFAKTYKFNLLTAFNSLKILQREGYIELTDEIDKPSKIYFIVNRDDLYKFQVENANFDGFIKLLLRSYSGLFSEYVSIDETYLAKKSALSVENVYNYLQKLNKQKIIKYIPKRDTPLVIYTEERLDQKALLLSYDHYKKRKELYIKRIESVLEYCTNNTKCRAQQLLAYFGEKESTRCGNCDICKKRNELSLSKYEFDLILKEIKNILEKNEVLVDELVDKINYPEEKTLNVIRWLLDNEKIIKTRENRYKWHD